MIDVVRVLSYPNLWYVGTIQSSHAEGTSLVHFCDITLHKLLSYILPLLYQQLIGALIWEWLKDIMWQLMCCSNCICWSVVDGRPRFLVKVYDLSVGQLKRWIYNFESMMDFFKSYSWKRSKVVSIGKISTIVIIYSCRLEARIGLTKQHWFNVLFLIIKYNIEPSRTNQLTFATGWNQMWSVRALFTILLNLVRIQSTINIIFMEHKYKVLCSECDLLMGPETFIFLDLRTDLDSCHRGLFIAPSNSQKCPVLTINTVSILKDMTRAVPRVNQSFFLLSECAGSEMRYSVL